MAEPVIIRIAGEPQGKGRARSRLIKPKGRVPFITNFTPEGTRKYEAHLQVAAEHAMVGRALLSGPLVVSVTAVFSVPPSWSSIQQAKALQGCILPTKAPDWDNLAKVCDALNKVVWGDDAQVVHGQVFKLYGTAPSLEVRVFEMDLPVFVPPPKVPRLKPGKVAPSLFEEAGA